MAAFLSLRMITYAITGIIVIYCIDCLEELVIPSMWISPVVPAVLIQNSIKICLKTLYSD